MKYTGHIKTGDYEFLQFEMEGTAEEAVESYKGLHGAWKGGSGLPARAFCAFMDTYLKTGKPGGIEAWEQMDDKQKHVINEVKKCLKRINK